MDLKKTGRLITRQRQEMKLTQPQLSELLFVTPQAVSSWENGYRYPTAANQVMIEKVMDLNPVELLTGVKMYDQELKKKISYHMKKVDEVVFTGGVFTDDDGNESYLDMGEFNIITDDGLIPYLEYHNAEPHVMTEKEKELKAKDDAIPRLPYNPSAVYINYGPAILIVSKDILDTLGKPKYFDFCKGDGWIGLRFGESGDFDIPEEVYTEKDGLMINGYSFGVELCRQMGISRMSDTMMVFPQFRKSQSMLFIDLIDAMRVKVEIDMTQFVLPTWQYEAELRIIEEEDAETLVEEDE